MDFRYGIPPPPPPSSMVDPHHHQPPQQPLPPPGPWFPGQFHFHPSQQSPPPPPQWAPPPQHSDYLPPPPYATPPPPPYASNHIHNHQYPLPHRAHMPPPHPHSQIPQSYPPVNQEWSNPSWGHQGWDFSVHKSEDDWAAKARAWAASKTVTDNQHQQSQYTPGGRQEELNHYHDPYSHNVDPHYSDVQQPAIPASSYQHYPSSATPPHRTPVVGHLQEPSSFSSGFVPDGHLPYAARDGTLAGDSAVAYHHQESSPTSLSVHQQEVPSSYSSVAGKEEAGERNGKFYQSLHMPFASAPQHHLQPPLPTIDRSVVMEHPHYAYGNQSAEPITDLRDQPLDFVPRFSRDHDPLLQSNYTNESGGPIRDMAAAASMPSIHAWTSRAAPGVIYPSVPPVVPSGPQVDPSVAVPSTVPAHSTPLFGRMAGPSFQPTMPSVNAPFPIGTGNPFHATTTFPVDTYGTSGVPERPKKASVPNWLREEIIKKNAVIGSSAPEFSKEDSISYEDEGIDRSLRKGDQADGKSIESSRPTEEEDDDEDDVEAAKTAAINQEIKRVLTEVLLKVTDELFDEIATKVLSEDNLGDEVEHNIVASNPIISPSTAVPTPKASAKVLIPAKTKETDSDDVSGKSTSSSPGDVLGLGNYASDNDEDDENQNSAMPSSKSSKIAAQKFSEEIHLAENGSSEAETSERSKNVLDEESDPPRMSLNGATGNHNVVGSELSHNRAGIEPVHGGLQSRYSSRTEHGAAKDGTIDSDGEKVLVGSDVSKSKDSVGEKVVTSDSITDYSQGRTTRDGSDKNNRSEAKRNSSSKESFKEAESGKDRTYRRVEENSRSQDERHIKRARKDGRNGSREKMKEQGVNSVEKAKDFDSSKRLTSADAKEDRKETERDRRSHNKEDDRKKDRAKDEKGERSRKLASDSSRHKRYRSSSIGSKGRSSKDNSTFSHANGSSGGSSDDSRRKVHSKQRNLSPSPVRSRRRQVSRSPHSKHSQRRHSPYSSLETKRGGRSRSRSRKG